MRSGSEAFLDTEIFSDHLTSKENVSFLLRCLGIFDNCYTSVMNIAEVLSACRSEAQKEKARRAFYGVGLLGIPYRYSDKLAEVLRYVKSSNAGSYRDALVVMMCSETKLPLITFEKPRYVTLARRFGVTLIEKETIEAKYLSETKH
jgi:predicted nucleic acid-binding protein